MKTSIIALVPHEKLKEIVAASKTRTEVIIKLGVKAQSGQFAALNKRLDKEQISYSHFVQYVPTRKNKIPNEIVFCANYKISGNALKIRYKACSDYRCKECGNVGNWNNKQLKLQLDHINGNNIDNRLENLRWLCPNCHSQTDTYAGKGKKQNRTLLVDLNIETLRQQERDSSHQQRKCMLLNSGINFSQFGWLIKASKLLDKTPQSTRHWMMKNMAEFYDKQCFKKYQPVL